MLLDHTNQRIIYINPNVKNKKELFRFISNDLANKGLVINPTSFYVSLMDREKIGNTEFLPEIAIPHAHCTSAKKLFLTIIISKEGIDFESPVRGNAKLVLLIGCHSANNKEYLKLLANASRIVRNTDLVSKLLTCSTPDEVINLLQKDDLHNGSNNQEDKSLLVITLHKREKLADLLTSLVEMGIGNASIVSASSLSKRIAYEIPIFAGLKLRNSIKSPETNLIFATISDNKLPSQIASLMKEEGIDFNKPNNGFIQVFSLKEIIGHSDEFI